jgi:hypothetical protein
MATPHDSPIFCLLPIVIPGVQRAVKEKLPLDPDQPFILGDYCYIHRPPTEAEGFVTFSFND